MSEQQERQEGLPEIAKLRKLVAEIVAHRPELQPRPIYHLPGGYYEGLRMGYLLRKTENPRAKGDSRLRAAVEEFQREIYAKGTQKSGSIVQDGAIQAWRQVAKSLADILADDGLCDNCLGYKDIGTIGCPGCDPEAKEVADSPPDAEPGPIDTAALAKTIGNRLADANMHQYPADLAIKEELDKALPQPLQGGAAKSASEVAHAIYDGLVSKGAPEHFGSTQWFYFVAGIIEAQLGLYIGAHREAVAAQGEPTEGETKTTPFDGDSVFVGRSKLRGGWFWLVKCPGGIEYNTAACVSPTYERAAKDVERFIASGLQGGAAQTIRNPNLGHDAPEGEPTLKGGDGGRQLNVAEGVDSLLEMDEPTEADAKEAADKIAETGAFAAPTLRSRIEGLLQKIKEPPEEELDDDLMILALEQALEADDETAGETSCGFDKFIRENATYKMNVNPPFESGSDLGAYLAEKAKEPCPRCHDADGKPWPVLDERARAGIVAVGTMYHLSIRPGIRDCLMYLDKPERLDEGLANKGLRLVPRTSWTVESIPEEASE
jgi:hypothetical protein